MLGGYISPANRAPIIATPAFSFRHLSLSFQKFVPEIRQLTPIADSHDNCYIAIVIKLWSAVRLNMVAGKFDGEAFFAAIDGQRIGRKLTWKKVAEQAQVPASTLTRMSQGRKPDVDSLASLCAWSGLQAEDFIRDYIKRDRPEALARITAHLRADPSLSKDGAKALETLIKTAYAQFRKK